MICYQGLPVSCCLKYPTLQLAVLEQAQADGEDIANHNFIRQALQPLVSMLLEQLTKQEPGQDRDEGIWNISMAAGTCLGLVAQCVKDEIVSLVMPYVQVGLAVQTASCTPNGQPFSHWGVIILCMHSLLCCDRKY